MYPNGFLFCLLKIISDLNLMDDLMDEIFDGYKQFRVMLEISVYELFEY